ncbi:MAG: NAD(P)/FAD-dependent oxidoreductase [Spirochaetales bacterium]|nr:NAD(P)/FAD-dependent oxidoreductase [Spirochaetales bacterium]
MIHDVIVVGAGPAGLFAAIQASSRHQVLLLEKKDSPGKKLLITGSGQCNLTHTGSVRDFLAFYGRHGSFLGSCLQQFQPDDLLDFFRKRNLEFYISDEGKYFPKTNQAADILNILIQECQKNGVAIKTCERIEKVQRKDQFFLLESNKAIYEAKKLILTTGGMSYPGTGSEGDGYSLAKSLGHSIIPPRPALTPVCVSDFSMSHLSGLSFKEVAIDLFRDHIKKASFTGDLLFTHKGLSGPVILNHSRYLLSGDVLHINFLHPLQAAGLIKEMLDYIQHKGSHSLINFFRAYPVSRNLVKHFFTAIGIKQDLKAAELSKALRTRLIQQLTNFQIEINKVQGFSHAMVTAGGIDLKQVDPRSFQSKICPGLYFAGEILDIDGDTGGYNLQAAFSTAFTAGKSV